MPTPVHFFLDDSSNVWANRAMDEFLGYKPGEVARLKTTDLYFEYAKEQHDKLVHDFLELGHARGDIMVGRKDGRLFEVAFHSTANVLPGIHLTIWESRFSAILHRDHFSWPAAPVTTGHHLTRRESQVISLLADGAGNAQVAAALGIAETTVQQHADSIRERLGAANRSEAISRAIAAGFTRPKRPGETLLVLSGPPDGESAGRVASATYLSPSSVAHSPALGRLVGSPFLILNEGDSMDLVDDPAAGLSSTLLVDGTGMTHLHGSISQAFGPGMHGRLHRLSPGLASLVVSQDEETGSSRVVVD